MDSKTLKKLKEVLEEKLPNRKFFILDPSSMSNAEIAETMREIKEYKEELQIKENIEKINKVFLN